MEIENSTLINKRKKHSEYMSKWRKNNRDKVRGYERKRYRKYPRWAEDRSLRLTKGITLKQKEEMLAKQGGKCAVCRTENPGGRDNKWVADHKIFGVLRGVLCTNCNLALGHTKDNIYILQNLIEYLKLNSNETNG
jgi:hypothetical protein